MDQNGLKEEEEKRRSNKKEKRLKLLFCKVPNKNECRLLRCGKTIKNI